MRGRGFGGEPDGENTTSCAEENLLGYPGTRYFGSSICVHEFSHGIMRGAIYTVDPEYRKAVEDAYAAAKKQGLSSAQGYPGNNFNEYWATGIEAYVFGSGRGPETLLAGRSAVVRARQTGDPGDEDARQRLRRADETVAVRGIGRRQWAAAPVDGNPRQASDRDPRP